MVKIKICGLKRLEDIELANRYKIDYSNQNMESVGFTHDGTPVNPGTFTILDTKTNETVKISIVPTTGRTVIKE